MMYTLYFDIYTSLICNILTSGLLPSTVSKNGVLSNSKARSTTSSPAPVPTCQNGNLEYVRELALSVIKELRHGFLISHC